MKPKFFILFLCSLVLFSCDSGGAGGGSNNGSNENGESNTISDNTVPVLLKNYIGRQVSYTIWDNNADIYKQGYLIANEEQIIKSYKKGSYKIKFKVSPWSNIYTYEYIVDSQCILGFSGTSHPFNFTVTESDFEVDKSPKQNVSVLLSNSTIRTINYSIVDDEAEVYKSGSLLAGESQPIATFKTGKYKMKFYVLPWGSQLNLTEFIVSNSRNIIFAGTSSPWNFYLTE